MATACGSSSLPAWSVATRASLLAAGLKALDTLYSYAIDQQGREPSAALPACTCYAMYKDNGQHTGGQKGECLEYPGCLTDQFLPDCPSILCCLNYMFRLKKVLVLLLVSSAGTLSMDLCMAVLFLDSHKLICRQASSLERWWSHCQPSSLPWRSVWCVGECCKGEPSFPASRLACLEKPCTPTMVGIKELNIGLGIVQSHGAGQSDMPVCSVTSPSLR